MEKWNWVGEHTLDDRAPLFTLLLVRAQHTHTHTLIPTFIHTSPLSPPPPQPLTHGKRSWGVVCVVLPQDLARAESATAPPQSNHITDARCCLPLCMVLERPFRLALVAL